MCVLVVQSCPILRDPVDYMPARLQCPWNSPDKNGVGCHSLPQGIFLTQGSNPGVSKCRRVPAGIWASRGAPLKVCTSDWNLGELPDGSSGEEELESLLMRVKEESETAGLKLNIQKSKRMTTGPITLWQIDGETMGTVTDFIFLGSKITADGDCSHEIKRHLLLGRKAMTNLDSVLKSRDITLLTKVHLVKAMVFPGVMYRCESWTIKKTECRRTDAFELWCWRRFQSPLDCKEIKPANPKGNQSWIFIRRTDTEAPILWPPDAKSWLIREESDAGKDWRQEEKGTTEDEMVGYHHWLKWYEFEQAQGNGAGQGSLACCCPWSCRVRHDWGTEQQQKLGNQCGED